MIQWVAALRVYVPKVFGHEQLFAEHIVLHSTLDPILMLRARVAMPWFALPHQIPFGHVVSLTVCELAVLDAGPQECMVSDSEELQGPEPWGSGSFAE